MKQGETDSCFFSQAECHCWVFHFLSYFVGFIPALHFLPLSFFPACFSVFAPFSCEVVYVCSHSLACRSLCACFGSQCFFWFCSGLSITLQFYSWILIYLIWCLPFFICCLLFFGFQPFFFNLTSSVSFWVLCAKPNRKLITLMDFDRMSLKDNQARAAYT